MAQETEVILFKAVFDADKAEQNVVKLTDSLSFLRAEKAALEKDFKAGAVGQEEYLKSMVALNRGIAATTAQLKAEEKALADNMKVSQAAEGSIVQLRAKLAILTEQYEELSDAERANNQVGGALVSQINSLTKEQEKNQQTLERSGKSARDYIKDMNVLGVNVGQTVDAFKSGASGVATFAKGILSGRGALIALTAVPIVLVLTALVSFLTKSKDGMELLGRKTAAVTAVFDYFSKLVVGVGRAIVAALDDPGKAVKALGSAIEENLSNRFKAFGLIIQAVKSGSFKDFANAVLQLGTGVTNVVGKVGELGREAAKAAAAGEALARQSQLIADAERRLNVERANSRAQVEKLKQLSDDVTKSNKERQVATQQAANIENNLLAKQQSLQSQKIANIKGEIALRGVSKDLLDQLAEAESRRGELAEENATRGTELQNKLNQIRIDGAKAALTVQVALTEQSYERAKQAGIKNALELGAIQEKLLAQQLALSLVGVVKGSEQEQALRTKYATDRAALNVATINAEENRLNAIRQSYLNTQLASVKKASAEEFELRRGALQQQYFQDVAAAKQTILNREQLDAKLEELDAAYLAGKKQINREEKEVELKNLDEILAARLVKTRAGSQAEANARKDIIRKQLADALADENVSLEQFKRMQAEAFDQIDKISENLRRQRQQAVVDGVSDVLGIVSKAVDAQVAAQSSALQRAQDAQLNSAGLNADERAKIEERFAEKKAKIDKDAAEHRREIALGEAAIATARGVIEAQILPPPFDIIKSVLVIATGIAQALVISSQQFEAGGVAPQGPVFGPSHRQGGIQMYHKSGAHLGEFEGEETILTKGVYRNPALRAMASMINEMGGGKRFASPLMSVPVMSHRFDYGGIMAMNAVAGTQSVIQAPIDYALLARLVGAEVGRANANLPAPQVSVNDIRSKTAQVVAVENRTSKTAS